MLGIDDWAWRKGRRHGAPICDLERREGIALPPDREPGTLAAWLAARPSVEIVPRDRGGGSATGARQGRPEAIQVAGRGPLTETASASFLPAVRRCSKDVRRALCAGALDPATLAAAERLQHKGWKRRVEAEAAAREAVDGFHALIRGGDPARLQTWLEAASSSPASAFAKRDAVDRDAVEAAVAPP